MNLTHSLIIAFCVAIAGVLPAYSQKSKNVHKEMHLNLLANAKSSIDKSVIQNYIKQELEVREKSDDIYEGLSPESVAMISDLLQEARTHMGKRYSRGSKGPNAFDCSGFTGYVFNQFGYKLGASSRDQYTVGDEIRTSELRPGDLVFFSSPRSGKGVGHVGIVTVADRENSTFSFIHASTTQGIIVSKSTEPYYKKRYIGARRIISE